MDSLDLFIFGFLFWVYLFTNEPGQKWAITTSLIYSRNHQNIYCRMNIFKAHNL
ncbi:hypothetical protein ERO13_A08G203333v2 [Gossypium hirsutum]|nr:hypothetical protein ERO13_A08G203333v2 [Gossypium hirsutum]KAG4189066.1 hypothetical protein ERO13_A08G203333v2 [Gossypium hirsutum]